ncbi:MAG: MBL fold metallo-hydrolase [Pseudomonadales bacterium]
MRGVRFTKVLVTRCAFRTLCTFRTLCVISVFFSSPVHSQAEPPFCGTEGVWIQILGAGGTELDDSQAGPSYLVWIDNEARILIDTAPGSALRYDESGADFNDLDAILLTHLHASHTGDFPAFVEGSAKVGRERPLLVFGPAGSDDYLDTQSFIGRLIGPMGAYAYLADFLTYRSSAGYKLNVRNVPATGRRRWTRFGNDHFRLSAIPVQHGIVPTIAWRADIGDQSIVFAGDFNDAKGAISDFAHDTDVLVVSHAIPESARGDVREQFVLPSQIGKVAAAANARMVILGHRTNRTRGLESMSRAAIEEHYTDALIFANDLECWGL